MAKIELSEKAIVMEINEECRKTSAAVSSFSVGYGRRSRPGTPKLFGSMERLPTGGPERERPMSAPPMPVRKDSNSSKAALVSDSYITLVSSVASLFNGRYCLDTVTVTVIK